MAEKAKLCEEILKVYDVICPGKNSSLIILNWQIDKNILVAYGTLHILLYNKSDPENSK